MKAASAIKQFVSEGSTKRVDLQEIMAFKAACDPEEFEELGRQAAELLGVDFTPKDQPKRKGTA